jgi:hypothetical protein
MIRFATTLTFDLADLVSPTAGYGFGENVGETEAFEIYRWMIATAERMDTEGNGPLALLRRHPYCTSVWSMYQDPIGGERYANVLLSSFQYALLGDPHDDRVTGSWRKKHRLDRLRTITIPVRHTAKRYECLPGLPSTDGMLGDILAFAGKFRKAPNECHPRATTIYNGQVATYADMQVITFRYGYAMDDSSWSFKLAVQKPGEAFDFTIARAWCRARMLAVPKDRWPRIWMRQGEYDAQIAALGNTAPEDDTKAAGKGERT